MREMTSAAYGIGRDSIADGVAERCQVSAFFATTARAGGLPGEENRTRHAPSERALWLPGSLPIPKQLNGAHVLRQNSFCQLGQGLAFGGVGPLRRDFGCRDEGKGALDQPRVGQFEDRTSTNHALTDQKVEVERAGSPTDLVLSVSPGGRLNLVAQG